MARLRADMDSILEMRGPEPETATVEIAEDTVLAALFTDPISPLLEPRECAKRPHSSCTSEGDEARPWKKERIDLEAARRASLIDEETRHMRACELVMGASSSRHEVVETTATEGAETAMGTTEGSGSGKPKPPAY